MKSKKKKEERIDIIKAQALGAYLRASADLKKTYLLLKKKVLMRDLKKWEREHRWPVFFEQHQNELLRDVYEDETLRKRQNLKVLRDAKEMVLESLTGTKDKDGLVIIPPVKARSQESCVECLINIINTEREIHGDKDADRRDDGLSLFSALLTAHRKGRSVNGNGHQQERQELKEQNDNGDTEKTSAHSASH